MLSVPALVPTHATAPGRFCVTLANSNGPAALTAPFASASTAHLRELRFRPLLRVGDQMT